MRKKNIILITINLAFAALLIGVLASCAAAKSPPLLPAPSLREVTACLDPYPEGIELSLLQFRELSRCLEREKLVRWHPVQSSGGCTVTYVMGPDGRMVRCQQCSGGIMYCS